MPCSEKRARQLLERGRAVVHRQVPFTIRLKDRIRAASQVQPLRLKLDPGAQVTGFAMHRQHAGEDKETVILLGELRHKTDIKQKLARRRSLRRTRRQRKCRYRPPRFLNRPRKKCAVCGRNTPKHPTGGRQERCRVHAGQPSPRRMVRFPWLPPSLRARVQQTVQLVRKLQNLLPIQALSQEDAKFDTQLLQNPHIGGVEYQHGTLAGYEVKEYLLEKYQRTCGYCAGATGDPVLEVDHVIPRQPAAGPSGTNRVSNLVIACRDCNQAKGNQQLHDWLARLRQSPRGLDQIRAQRLPHVFHQLQEPLHAVALLNATRQGLYRALLRLRLPLERGTGALTKQHRLERSLPKTHYIDAICVGASTPPTLAILTHYVTVWTVKGRGTRQMCRPDPYGFPKGHRTRRKTHLSTQMIFPLGGNSPRTERFQSGDQVVVTVPSGYKTPAGVYRGRIQIRQSGWYALPTPTGKLNVKHSWCGKVQRGDGWLYESQALPADIFPSAPVVPAPPAP